MRCFMNFSDVFQIKIDFDSLKTFQETSDQIKFKLIDRKEGRYGTEMIKSMAYQSLAEVIGPEGEHKKAGC